MKLVECTSNYWEFVRTLRTDARVVGGFIEQVEITPEEQQRYMSKYSSCYRIALVEEVPVGFVGVIDNDIRVCTHPDYQGRGVGKFMINSCMDIWPEAFAKVKLDNEASIKLFESCGFSKKFFILTKD
jgi:ribosomal protein S18 acetylase RimI-like enzyme